MLSTSACGRGGIIDTVGVVMEVSNLKSILLFVFGTEAGGGGFDVSRLVELPLPPATLAA
jgi:hypothetical protein